MLRLRYVTQVMARPPTFAAFVSGAEELSESTTKFLLNSLRRKFGFPGVPLRLVVRHKNAEKRARRAAVRKHTPAARSKARMHARRRALC